jgi:hypothetical protein
MAWPADRQHPIAALRVVHASCQVVAQVIVADRLARRERAIAEDQEGLAGPDAFDLAGQGLEEGRGAHNRIADSRFDQCLFEGQLGMLEGQQGLLHTDG